jgi:hypothetical protein
MDDRDGLVGDFLFSTRHVKYELGKEMRRKESAEYRQKVR